MRRILAAGALALALVGCGDGDARVAAPPALPASAVPERLGVSGGIVVQPDTSKQTQEAFRSVGPDSLVVEARVWELRKDDQLAGTLQVATLDGRRADTSRTEDREAIHDQILVGEPTELELAGLPVWSATTGERVLYVWYGRQVFVVLQVKADEIDAERAAEELVTAMVDADGWPALPSEVFEEEDL